MIRRVEVIFRKTGVWARGNVYDTVPLVTLKDRQVMFERNYPKNTRTVDVWDDIRDGMTDAFFQIFYPAVIWQTASPEPPTPNPSLALTHQSKYIRGRQSKLPEYYEWDPDFGKWHMNMEGYLNRTRELGGELDIGVSTEPYGDMFDHSMLDVMQEKYKGTTKTIVLFIYPDKYDEEVRALFELRVTFW